MLHTDTANISRNRSNKYQIIHKLACPYEKLIELTFNINMSRSTERLQFIISLRVASKLRNEVQRISTTPSEAPEDSKGFVKEHQRVSLENSGALLSLHGRA